MVCTNKGLPEPPDNDDTLTGNNEVVIANDTDSDDDLNEYNGYQPLALGPDDGEQIVSDEDEDDDVNDVPNTLPPIPREADTLGREVWSFSASSVVDIEMDKEKENEVKEAMVNFTLPSTSIPEWANNIPEEEWKDHLLRKLQNRNRGNDD